MAGSKLFSAVKPAFLKTRAGQNRARFIEHVYMMFSDDLDARIARH